MEYIIGLGGNLGDPKATLLAAMEHIDDRIGAVVRRSPFFWTKPMLHPVTPTLGQAPHLNSVIVADSDLPADQVLAELLKIEEELGRVRANDAVPWGPRVIDLDIVAAEQTVVETPELTIPHPEMHARDFVLIPMLSVAPEWCHPTLEKTVQELEAELAERWVLSEEQAAVEARF